MKFGNLDIVKSFLGELEISKIMLGSYTVYTKKVAAPKYFVQNLWEAVETFEKQKDRMAVAA